MTDTMAQMILDVKFGTPKPVPFREYRECGNQVMDLDLEARFVGRCEVSEYDAERYATDEEVSMFIKSNCSRILRNCLDNWPEGESVLAHHFKGLDERFSAELKEIGIIAKTEFVILNLTEESENLYKEHLNMITSPTYDKNWDRMHPDTVISRPEGTYMVTSIFFALLTYKDGRVFYKPGERVDVDFNGVASDTSYHVTVNAPDLDVKYGSVIHISFTMPEHDVHISIASQSVMTYMPDKNGDFIGGPQLYHMNSPASTPGSEWTCPSCGSRNTGNFCTECGGARPKAALK